MGKLTIVTFVLLAAAQATNLPAPVGVLTGTVTDRDGNMPGTTISVFVGASARTAITNGFGKYRIEDIPVGTYRVEARMTLYVTRRAEVTMVAGQATSWDPVLEIRRFRSTGPPVGPDPTDSRLAAGIYEAILRKVYRGQIPSQPTIGVGASLIQPFDDDLDWPTELAEVPPELRQRSRTADALTPVRLRPESLPPGARLVEGTGLVPIPYTAFSRVFATADTLNALVVFEHRCGNLCGEVTLAWLTRETLSSPWTIRSSFTFWIS